MLALILIANPWYLEMILIYRRNGFATDFYLGPLYHASIAGLGFVLLFGTLVGPSSIHRRVGIGITVAAISVVSVLAFVVYSWSMAEALAPSGTRILGFGHRKTFIASVVAAMFVTGAAVSTRRPTVLLGVPVVLVVGLGFVALDHIEGSRLVADVVLLVVFHHLLSIPFIGGLLLAAAAVFGGMWAHNTSENSPQNT